MLGRARTSAVPAFLVGLAFVSGNVTATRADDWDQLVSLQKQFTQLESAERYRDAEPIALRMLAVARRLEKDDPAVVAACLNYLATAYHGMAQFDRAEPIYRQALEAYKGTVGEADGRHIASLIKLAQLYADSGQTDRAERHYLRAVELIDAHSVKDDRLYTTGLRGLAALYYLKGEYERAEPLMLKAVEIRGAALGNEADFAESLSDLATLYDEMENYSKRSARPLLTRAVGYGEFLISLAAEHER